MEEQKKAEDQAYGGKHGNCQWLIINRRSRRRMV
jgi:hypothetical protein